MTFTFAANANNDIYLAPGGDLAKVTGLDAVMQNCQTAMQAQRGEMMYAMQKGMPTRAVAWDTYNPKLFEAAARIVLLGVIGVRQVLAFSVRKSGTTLNYSATIQTIYGTQTINGQLPISNQ